jgi:ABC-2 type transport system ATP-binding protein
MAYIIEGKDLSKWYGNVLGVSEISINIESGIHGILGPNGAGKSILLKLMIGQLKPNIGKIKIFGEPVFGNYKLFGKIGYCPEFDTYYSGIKAIDFMIFKAKLLGFEQRKAEKEAKNALARIGLEEDSHRLISEFSMGMRQRLKFASSIIHNPNLLILDEPLRGVDPLWRINIIKILKEFESMGKTVIVSSHILSEVESLTNRVILIHQGKVFAQGDIQEIRGLIDSHPHKISIQCNNPRELAREMVFYDFVKNVLFNDKEQKIIIETDNREHFFSKLMETIVKTDSDIREIISPDDNLQAVFDYLIGR